MHITSANPKLDTVIEPVRVIRILQTLVEQDCTVEVQQISRYGEVVDEGICAVLDFDPTQGCLIVDVPTHDGQPIGIAQADRATVHLHFNGSRYRFETKVLEHGLLGGGYGSGPLLRLAAPQTLENANRREHLRVTPRAKDMPVVAWRPLSPANLDDLPWLDSRAKDISGNGICIKVSTALWSRLALGLRVELSLQLPGSESTITTKATVRRLLELDECYIGVSYDDGEIDEISSYVIRCQHEIDRVSSD